MGSKKVCRWSLLFSLCLHFTTKSWYLQKNIWNIIAAMTCMWILWALNFGGIVVEWLGHWTSLVVSGSALHPNTHCFVFGCPKFNSQAVLVKSLLVCTPCGQLGSLFLQCLFTICVNWPWEALLGKWSVIIIIIIIVIILITHWTFW